MEEEDTSVQCGHCFERCQDENGPPKELKCGHILCLACAINLSTLFKDEGCPRCKSDLEFYDNEGLL